jgi:hypothetical protein
MEFSELKGESSQRVLLRGKSGRGKTRTCCEIALEMMSEGYTVKYVDTENEGSNTLVTLVEQQDYEKDVVENLDYHRVESYEDMKSIMSDAEDYNLLIFDTLDHKYSYVLKAVTDARTSGDVDWSEYPKIYSEEKEFMDSLTKLDVNLLATLDPESGKTDKAKGVQANVHGYFSTVIDLYRDGDDWTHKVENWVGRSDLIGGSIGNVSLTEALVEEFSDRAIIEA